MTISINASTYYTTTDWLADLDGNNGYGWRDETPVNSVNVSHLFAPSYAFFLLAQDKAGVAENAAEAITGPGFSLQFAFDDSTTDSDPGSGKIRLNNATPASATEIYIDDVESSGANVESLLLTIDDSTSASTYGQFSIRKRNDKTVWHIYDVTALSDNSGYVGLTVSHIAGNGSLSDGDDLVIGFVRSGDKGDEGSGSTIHAKNSAGTIITSAPRANIREADSTITLTDNGTDILIACSLTQINDQTSQSVSASSTTNIDLDNGDIIQLDQNSTNITTLNITNADTINKILLIITNTDTSDRYTISWPSSFSWLNGSSPTLESKAIVYALTTDGGTNWTAWYEEGIVDNVIKNELYAWGNGGNGRLGDGTISSKSSPVQIGALTNWSKVSAGGDFSTAIKSNGTLWSWGENGVGELGDGTTVDKSSPVQIGALTNWSKVSSGGSFSAAIKTNGTLWTWGDNSSGQLGDGTTTNKSSPVQIGALTDWSEVYTGNNFCIAIKNDGSLWGWGENGLGQLGDGTTTDKSSPVQLGALTWSKIACGNQHSLGIQENGTLWAWGEGSYGRLGDGTAVDKSSPVQIGSDEDWGEVSAGLEHSLGLKTGGLLLAWGHNNLGQLGDGTTTDRSSPVQIGDLSDWSKVSAGSDFSAAIKTNGTLWTWGYGNNGELGNSDNTNRSSPIMIGSLTNRFSISHGANHQHLLLLVEK